MNETHVEQVTHGPLYHWFGYYDKLQFDPSGRFLLSMEVDFEHRSPEPDDRIKIGMVDLEKGNRWTELGTSTAWCWQQGCMLQWRPGSETEILWNDREQDRFVCRILDIESGKKKTVPFPVYTVSPDGRTAFGPDFSRINEMRPGYGYAGFPDPNRNIRVPDSAGIRRIDLETGEESLIVSLGRIADIPFAHGDISTGRHYVNHLLISPDGSRLEFLNRWRNPPEHGWTTRMFTCAPDGSDIRAVDDCGYTSHFIWRSPGHILAWSRAYSDRGDFCLFDEKTGEFEPVGSDVMVQDGHVNCIPESDWLVNDTYPDTERNQHLYLYHVPSGKRTDLASFYLSEEYAGEWRTDLHPRISPDGTRVCVDSPCGGNGRQMYIVDISN